MNQIFGIDANALLSMLLVLTGIIIGVVALSAWLYPLPFRLGVRNLPRRKNQTALIIGGLALSTMIITSALGIGDTIDYSSTANVYDTLGKIDLQIGATRVKARPSFGFSSGPAQSESENNWFDAAVAEQVAALVDGQTIDGAAPAVVQALPILNTRTNLSEAAIEIRGISSVTGDGLTPPPGWAALTPGQVLVNQAAATALDAAEGDTLLLIQGQPTPVQVAGVAPDGELAGDGAAVLMPLDQAQALFERPGQINAVWVSNANGNQSAIERLTPAVAGLTISPIKADALEAAENSAAFVTTLFITFGAFSIFSGVLLIFLIFTVLAAERRPELGISRAVGQQRTDLIRQFVTEGLAYNLIAAAAGAALGVIAALLLSSTLLRLLAGSADLNIAPRVTLRSVLIGYTLGLVITFFTVSLSAVRISQVNIIAAIRDLNLPTLPRQSQWTLFLHPFRVWRSALRQAGQRRFSPALKLFLLAGPRAIYDFWMGLLARGPLLLTLGFLLAWAGVNVVGQAGVYGMGVAFFIVGMGQLAAWLGAPTRLAYSLTGLALILYWALPTRSVGKLAELETNAGDFFISGMFLVGGAIVLFLYNAELLLNLFARVLGRAGRLLPITRIAIAYPMAAKGRTATTLAMFSLVTFTLVGTATITNTFGNFLDTESGSGGYEVLAQSNPFNPISPGAFAAQIAELTAGGEMAEPTALAAAVFAPVQAQSATMSRPANYVINGVDDAFFVTHRLELAGAARGFASAEAVWAAVQADPTLVVIDNFSVDRTGDPTYQRDEEAFIVASIRAGDATFEPTPITLIGSDGAPRQFTVIGVLGTAPSFYGALMNAQAAAGLGHMSPNRYFLRLPAGADARAAANAIESAFGRSGLQTTLLKEQLADSRRSVTSIFYLIQGFVGLGLLIGISALGVITIRSVVERRQHIGVLRAIGFQREMVQAVFMIENLFVGGLASIIGYALALAFSYNLYLQVAADQGLPFAPPWPILIGIGVGIFAAALATAWLHSRRSARVVIAEALRYQG